ncbi:hypothetical protein PACTADRAFT_49686 [Pachysolen tannophilus NRRL Y-2460]|uniref:SGF29 C-terminal domain-containing protein n=1 Tax=Pachysolen tannophilus NRRL Y-2460 TaxID=669874 RepID=A0A1E4TX02_PACTA|nr:hypothetical protein PACTADRAFT_49686 [Pachysolen tannophilus NRRL Y-2460]
MAAGKWDVTTSLLQDIFNANENNGLDSIYNASWLNTINLNSMSKDELNLLREKINIHKENAEKSTRILENVIENVTILSNMNISTSNNVTTDSNSSPIAKSKQKTGKSFYQSVYNASEPVVVGSEVAFKLRHKGMDAEWIQCECTKIISETKLEVRDPEPDENNNPGQTYKATWKEIILLPPKEDAHNLINYPYGTKVLARYPETTTFYPAEVIGTKRDGRCRLRFEGEEEISKETEVERRLVLPFPR